jgi:hypothetical protein
MSIAFLLGTYQRALRPSMSLGNSRSTVEGTKKVQYCSVKDCTWAGQVIQELKIGVSPVGIILRKE